MQEKIINYISSKLPTEVMSILYNRISQDLNVTGKRVDTIQEFFPLLSNPNFHTDYIAVDVEHLESQPGVNSFELISTLSTLIKCTVHRPESGKPIPRNTKIVAIVGDSTPATIIKNIIMSDDISYVMVRCGGNFNYEMFRDSIVNFLEEKDRIPKIVQNLIKNKKLAKINSEINLTTRQNQILNLVSNRGASNKAIGKILNISESTVKLHMSAILKKYGLRNRTQLALFAKNQEQTTPNI
jgi:DNA-binding NarL/FixJ family response regulator